MLSLKLFKFIESIDESTHSLHSYDDLLHVDKDEKAKQEEKLYSMIEFL